MQPSRRLAERIADLLFVCYPILTCGLILASLVLWQLPFGSVSPADAEKAANVVMLIWLFAPLATLATKAWIGWLGLSNQDDDGFALQTKVEPDNQTHHTDHRHIFRKLYAGIVSTLVAAAIAESLLRMKFGDGTIDHWKSTFLFTSIYAAAAFGILYNDITGLNTDSR